MSRVYATRWYSELLVSAQMLASIVYWCGAFHSSARIPTLRLSPLLPVILGSGLDHVLDLAPSKPEKDKNSTALAEINPAAPAPSVPSTPADGKLERTRSTTNLVRSRRAASRRFGSINDYSTVSSASMDGIDVL